MRRCLAWAMLALLLVSGVPLAIGEGGHGNQSVIFAGIQRNAVNSVNGTLRYFDYSAVIPDDWQSSIINGVESAVGAYTDSASGPLTSQTITVSYTDENGELVELGQAVTDSQGRFGLHLPDTAIDWSTVSGPGECTMLVLSFAGTDDDPQTNPPTRSDLSYCRARDYQLPLTGVNFYNCIPVILVFGVLAAAMYASGSDPLRAFDISTPRLPGPKYKQMSQETKFLPGWKIQRQAQIRAMNDTEKALKLKLADVERLMGSRWNNARDFRKYSNLNSLLKNYKANQQMIKALREARGLTWAQKSILIEVLYLVPEKMKSLAGADKAELTRILNRNDAKALNAIRAKLEKDLTAREALDIKRQLKEKVSDLEKETRELTESERKKNPDLIAAAGAVGALSMISGSTGPGKPGIRETNEQATYAFDSLRRWMMLGSSKHRGLDKVGRFVAKTPGLSGEFATIWGTVAPMFAVHYRFGKSIVVDGLAGGAIRTADRGLGDVFPSLKTARKAIENSKSVGMDKKLANAANGFDGINQEIRAIVAQLRRDNRISDQQAWDILTTSSQLYKRSNDILGDPGLSKDAKLKALAGIQGEYKTLLAGFGNTFNESLDAQRTNRGTGYRYYELVGELNTEFTTRIRERGVGSLSKSEIEKLKMELGSERVAQMRADRTLGHLTQSEIEKLKMELGSERVAQMRADRTLGEHAREKNLGRIRRETDPVKRAELLALYAKSWIGDLEDIGGRSGDVERKGKLHKIYEAMGRGAVQDSTIKALMNAIAEERKNIADTRKGISPSTQENKLLLGQLERLEKRLSEIENNAKFVEGKKVGKKDEEKSADDFIHERGYIDRQTVSIINKWLELSQDRGIPEEKFGKPKQTDIMLTKQESDQTRLNAARLASKETSEMLMRREAMSETHAQASRRKLTGRLEAMLREGKSEDLNKLFEYVALGRMGGVDSDYNELMQRYFLGFPDVNEFVLRDKALGDATKKYSEILSKNMSNRQKAELLANLFVESHPWYRKKQIEYAETLTRALGSDSLVNIRTGEGITGVERKNYLAANLIETNRRLQSWVLTNDELLDRGILPGGEITKEEALRKGAWIGRAEGYWQPASSKNKDRDKKIDAYIRSNMAGADRLIYGELDNKTGEVLVKEKKSIPYLERLMLAGLYDIGQGSLDMRAAVSQSWMTIGDLGKRYVGTEMHTKDGCEFTLSDMQNQFMRNAYKMNEIKKNAEFEIMGLKSEFDSANDRRRREIDGEITAIRENRNEEIKRIKQEMKEQKKLMDSLLYGPTTLQVAGGLWSALLSGPRDQSTGGPYGATNFSESVDNWARSFYGKNVNEFDPMMGRFSRNALRTSYEMAFLGIMGLRSPRAMSAYYMTEGPMASGYHIWGNAMMEPRKYNYVDYEWSEADVARVAFYGSRLQENIPLLRHLNYGSFLRTMALPAIHDNQRVGASMRHAITLGDGVAGQWEPQFVYPVDKKSQIRGARMTAQAVTRFMPFPFNALGALGTTLNPTRDGWLASRVPGVSELKYSAYSLYSKAGGTNYALEGKTDMKGYSAGGPIYRMGNIDAYYSSDYAGGYQPMFFFDPYMDNRRSFPSWVNRLYGTVPGLVGDRFDMANPEIFRRETTAAYHLQRRAAYERKGEGWRSLRDFSTIGFPFYIGRSVKYGFGPLSESQLQRDAFEKKRREEERHRRMFDSHRENRIYSPINRRSGGKDKG